MFWLCVLQIWRRSPICYWLLLCRNILWSHCGVEIQHYNWISFFPMTKRDTEATHLKRFKNILGDYLSTSSSCQVSPCVFPRVLIKTRQTNKSIWCASHTQQVPLCCSLMLSKVRRELCSQLPGLQPITSHCFPLLGQSCASPAPPSHPSSSFASSCWCWEFTLWWTNPKSLKTEMNCCNIYRLIRQCNDCANRKWDKGRKWDWECFTCSSFFVKRWFIQRFILKNCSLSQCKCWQIPAY